jgi:hypothetical protein
MGLIVLSFELRVNLFNTHPIRVTRVFDLRVPSAPAMRAFKLEFIQPMAAGELNGDGGMSVSWAVLG